MSIYLQTFVSAALDHNLCSFRGTDVGFILDFKWAIRDSGLHCEFQKWYVFKPPNWLKPMIFAKTDRRTYSLRSNKRTMLEGKKSKLKLTYKQTTKIGGKTFVGIIVKLLVELLTNDNDLVFPIFISVCSLRWYVVSVRPSAGLSNSGSGILEAGWLPRSLLSRLCIWVQSCCRRNSHLISHKAFGGIRHCQPASQLNSELASYPTNHLCESSARRSEPHASISLLQALGFVFGRAHVLSFPTKKTAVICLLQPNICCCCHLPLLVLLWLFCVTFTELATNTRLQ